MNIETEQLKLKLIETQMALLQYQHKEVLANIAQLQAKNAQVKFNAAVDMHDTPSGAITAPDPYAGD